MEVLGPGFGRPQARVLATSAPTAVAFSWRASASFFVFVVPTRADSKAKQSSREPALPSNHGRPPTTTQNTADDDDDHDAALLGFLRLHWAGRRAGGRHRGLRDDRRGLHPRVRKRAIAALAARDDVDVLPRIEPTVPIQPYQNNTHSHRLLSAPWSAGGSRSSSRPLRALDGPAAAHQRPPALAPPAAAAAAGSGGQGPLPYKVGLLDLTVPSRRSPGYTNLLLANDMCIERAVQGVYVLCSRCAQSNPPI